MAPSRNGHSHITGWGVDLDHQNRPAYPKERTPPRLENVHWKYPQQQPVKAAVFHSLERPGITPVFGSTVPPRGVSGFIRRQAYQLSENDLRHWLMLMLADRVNVLEGLAQDARRSKKTPWVAAALLAAGALSWALLRRPRYRRLRWR